MHFNAAAVAVLAGAANAAPHIHAGNHLFPRSAPTTKIGTTVSASNSTNSSSTPAGGYKSVVYWGQSQNKILEDVCKEDVDTVVMAFVNKYGNETKGGEAVASGFAPDWACATNGTDDWSKQGCANLGKNVTSCQKAGKKVLISVGGWLDYSTMSQGQGKTLADSLWSQFADSGSSNVLGGVTLDGFDFDIEHDNDNNKLASYTEAAQELRSKIGSSGKILTGAPMCVAPSENVMTDLMKAASFDELYFQYYNNAPCGANDTKGAVAAWDSWYQELQGGASKNAKLFLGLLGAEKGAGIDGYFIDEPQTASLVGEMKNHKGFAGTMVWDAGYSMNQTTPSGNYLDSCRKALGGK